MAFLQLNYTSKAATGQPFGVTRLFFSYLQDRLNATAPFLLVETQSKPKNILNIKSFSEISAKTVD